MENQDGSVGSRAVLVFLSRLARAKGHRLCVHHDRTDLECRTAGVPETREALDQCLPWQVEILNCGTLLKEADHAVSDEHDIKSS